VKKKLSIIVPIYNEKNTVGQVLDRIMAVKIPLIKQIILVDDCSTDDTAAILTSLQNSNPLITIVTHDVNRGKGAAIRSGLKHANGDIVLIQDADLEYDPALYPKLLAPILDGNADVVYGSRFVGGAPHRVLFFWHYVGNRILTLFSNMLTNLNLTDMEVGYKLFRREVLEDIEINENRFGFEPEITAKIAKKNLRIFEVGIPYYGRSYDQGKKITWKDGIAAIYAIIRYNFFH
jgi:glycosyltransferase involved in cell wall biosynthesis